MVDYRSYSQLQQYNRCPLSYKLARIDRVWRKPAAWLSQGSAEHEAFEARELSGRTLSLEATKEVYAEAYQRIVNEMTEQTPYFRDWFRSGRYGGKEDVERRFLLGLDQIESYFAWYDAHPEEVPWITPDGRLAVELEFDVMFGSVRVKGFIDFVGLDELRRLMPRDNKSGNKPGEIEQLGVYRAALMTMYPDHEVSQWGDFWMGKFGKPTPRKDLSAYTVESVTEMFEALEDNIRSERFDPDPEDSKCMFCDVKASCPIWN